MMGRLFIKICAVIAISLFLAVPFPGRAEGEGAGEKVLGLENVIVTHYALGGDTPAQKTYGEALYLSKGTPRQALITLKEIVLEGKKPSWSFTEGPNRDHCFQRDLFEIKQDRDRESSFERFKRGNICEI